MLIPLALCPLMRYLHCFDTMFVPKGSTPVLLDLFIQERVLFSFPTPCPAQTCCLHTCVHFTVIKQIQIRSPANLNPTR